MDPPVELTVESAWNEVASRLQGALNETTYRTWFGDAEAVDVSDDAFVVAVPNDFTREWIEGHYVGLLRAIVQDATGRERRIQITVHDGRHATPPGGIDPLQPSRSAYRDAEARSTRSTPSTRSSSARPTGSRTRPRLRSRRRRPRRTTRCSSTAAPGSARPT